MDWLDWTDEAFAEARRRECPVLLLISASWCRWSAEFEEEVLGSPPVAELVREHFVAVRVDKDRRPDIDARYSKGGWPTLAYLDDTGELMANDAYLEVEALVSKDMKEFDTLSSYTHRVLKRRSVPSRAIAFERLTQAELDDAPLWTDDYSDLLGVLR